MSVGHVLPVIRQPPPGIEWRTEAHNLFTRQQRFEPDMACHHIHFVDIFEQ